MFVSYDLFQHTYLDVKVCGLRNEDERHTLCKMDDRSNIACALIIAERGYESYTMQCEHHHFCAKCIIDKNERTFYNAT